MSLADDAMSAVSNAQHADLAISNLGKAKRSRSGKWSIRSSRERKRIVRLTTIINNLEINIAKRKTRLALLQTLENNALKSLVEHLEQQIYMQDSLIEALRMEDNRLEIATGQVVPNSGPTGMMPFGVPHNFALNPQQQAAQAHDMMQQQQAVQAQVQMRLQPQVMMLPEGQGLIPPSCPNAALGSGGEAATGEGAHAAGKSGSDAAGGGDASGELDPK